MGMFEDLQKQYVDARKAQDKFVSGVLNMVISDLKYEKINKQRELEDADVIAYLQKSIKGKKEVFPDYEKANRQDLLEKETKEVGFLSSLLPQMLSEDEVRKIVLQAKADIGASSPADMGKLMKEAMNRVKGKSDGATVKNIVNEVLKI